MHASLIRPTGCAGEQGAQVRELLDQNPVVAAPIVFYRLQQKDAEWCAGALCHSQCCMASLCWPAAHSRALRPGCAAAAL